MAKQIGHVRISPGLLAECLSDGETGRLGPTSSLTGPSWPSGINRHHYSMTSYPNKHLPGEDIRR
jgi:hypothetical protein